MEKLNISLENIHPIIKGALQPLLKPTINNTEVPKISMSTTDIKYVEYLIEKGDIIKAKEVLRNLKSVAKNINLQIMDVESFLASMEL